MRSGSLLADQFAITDVGEDVESCVHRLLAAADYDVDRAG